MRFESPKNNNNDNKATKQRQRCACQAKTGRPTTTTTKTKRKQEKKKRLGPSPAPKLAAHTSPSQTHRERRVGTAMCVQGDSQAMAKSSRKKERKEGKRERGFG